jgi:putative flippase GtrA
MKTLIRWGKFNLVGAMGMVLQLAALAAFNRWLHGHYLVATAAAIELTLLHNFAWHWCYTWRERRCDVQAVTALMQFHLSNGMVSLVGNLALMRLLVQQAHLPVLGANVVAIACCSVVNFSVANSWVFAKADGSKRMPRLNW